MNKSGSDNNEYDIDEKKLLDLMEKENFFALREEILKLCENKNIFIVWGFLSEIIAEILYCELSNGKDMEYFLKFLYENQISTIKKYNRSKE